MFRITQFMNEISRPTPAGPRRDPPGPVVIWNLIRRCNLTCKHCYSISADHDFPGELSTEEVFAVMDDLRAFRVPALILSGGEPLLRPDIFPIARRAKEMGFYVGLSSNGTLIDEAVASRNPKEFVTGNNDADGVYLLHWVRARFPEHADHMAAKLVQWGGNASGVNVANIDNVGDVHPDTMWWHHTLGNVRTRPFSAIWPDTSDPIMAGLKRRPRVIEGRCGACRHFDICGGNTRVRALRLTGNPWAEDPACYLTDDEIGVDSNDDRLQVRPFGKGDHAVGAVSG